MRNTRAVHRLDFGASRRHQLRPLDELVLRDRPSVVCYQYHASEEAEVLGHFNARLVTEQLLLLLSGEFATDSDRSNDIDVSLRGIR